MCLKAFQIARQIRLLFVLWTATLIVCIPTARAVELQPGKGIADLGPYLQFHSDAKASLATVLERFRKGKFQPELSASMLASNYAPEAWAAVSIDNATIDDGRGADAFVVTLSLALASAVDIYLVRSNNFTENLLNYSAFQPFVPENYSVMRLRTPQFKIAPQETVTLLVHFKFGPIQTFRLALETPPELEASAFSAGLGYSAFYAFCISSLIFFFGFHFAMKNRVGFLYAILFSVGLAFVAYIDGLWFRFFYPDDPQWHSLVGFGLLFALSGVGFFVAGRSVWQEGKPNRLANGVSLMALLSLAGFLASLFSPGTYVALVAYVLLGLSLLANFWASSKWRKQEGNIHIGALIVGGFSGLAIAAVLAWSVLGSTYGNILVQDVVKVVYAAMLLFTMTGLTAHVVNLRLKHAKAVKLQVAALEDEAKRSQELLVAERNYSRARELASLRQKQLATASHDLKQPIASLRMTFDSIAEKTDPQLRDRLREAFDYMEALSSGYLDETTPGSERDNVIDSGRLQGSASAISTDKNESYELSIILGTVHQMFEEEAISKGLKLKWVSSSVVVNIPPVVLMRIIANLVSNAIKYTLKGTVLIGVRRRGNKAVVYVIDTGPGMDESEIERFKTLYQKGENSQGQGLGLAVVFELAQEQGLEVLTRSEKAKGTCFALAVPVAG